jgi:hypothetical protein
MVDGKRMMDFLGDDYTQREIGEGSGALLVCNNKKYTLSSTFSFN